jgi:hypothetical protein
LLGGFFVPTVVVETDERIVRMYRLRKALSCRQEGKGVGMGKVEGLKWETFGKLKRGTWKELYPAATAVCGIDWLSIYDSLSINNLTVW